jgi:hypothetical protein
MSDSDESEDIGYLVEQSDAPESDELDQSHDESGSESGAEDPAHELLDLEAVDSDEEEKSGSDESDAVLWSDDYFFPQFKRLPPELRIRIWEFFCPDLTAESRLYWFRLHPVSHKPAMTVHEGPFLEQQTRPTRTMLAVHQESRQLALKAFPDALSFRDHSVLRFNSHKDIVLLDARLPPFRIETLAPRPTPFHIETLAHIPGFSSHVRHLAVEPPMLFDFERCFSALSDAFENLETAYYTTDAADHDPRHLRWCTTDLAKRYSVTTFEEQPGLGEDAQHLYCWPDTDKHGALVAEHIPLDGLADDLSKVHLEMKGATLNHVPIWPLVQFLWESNSRRFDDLAAWDGEGELDWESSVDEDSGEPNEYESEGIDDSEISDDDDSEASEDRDLIVLDEYDDSDQDEAGSGGGSSASGSPQHGHRRETIDLTGDDHERVAGFSSPERSSATLQGSDGSASESDQPVPRTSRLKRPRGGVVGSESEDDQDDDVPRKRARTENRGIPIVLSSDDEETETRKMRANRRARAIVPEDEDEEDEQEDGATESDASSPKEEDEDSEGGAAVSKPMSLAEKLQLHRERNPIPPSDDEDSDIEEMRGDDYDARDYADFQDDEEGNEISEDGEDDDQQELIMDDDEDDQEDYEY